MKIAVLGISASKLPTVQCVGKRRASAPRTPGLNGYAWFFPISKQTTRTMTQEGRRTRRSMKTSMELSMPRMFTAEDARILTVVNKHPEHGELSELLAEKNAELAAKEARIKELEDGSAELRKVSVKIALMDEDEAMYHAPALADDALEAQVQAERERQDDI